MCDYRPKIAAFSWASFYASDIYVPTPRQSSLLGQVAGRAQQAASFAISPISLAGRPTQWEGTTDCW